MIFHRERGTKHRAHSIADVLIERPTLLLNDVGHSGKVFIHEVNKSFWSEIFRKSGEALNITEKSSDYFLAATQLRFLFRLDHLMDHFR